MEKNAFENLNTEAKLKYIYVWLSQIEDFNYALYIRLLKIFNSIENLYSLTKNKRKFKEILIQNKIILSENLINQLTNFNLKNESYKLYNNLIKQNIEIINIEDRIFPKEKFSNMYNLPICIYVYGNINKLNEKVIYIHKENFNKYGNDLYKIFNNYIGEKKWNHIIYIKEFEKKNYLVQNILKNKIFIVEINIFNINFKLENYVKEDINNLYIFYPNAFENATKRDLQIIELIVSISNLCLIIQAKYDKNMYIKNIVEMFLEQGKEVLVVPGNIYCKFSYFSNYLIKEGAEIILNKHDIDKYL